ncbi:MAG TPA: hypothetical protein VGK63_06330, partial [Candidatus Limnocylindrales bacterium]
STASPGSPPSAAKTRPPASTGGTVDDSAGRAGETDGALLASDVAVNEAVEIAVGGTVFPHPIASTASRIASTPAAGVARREPRSRPALSVGGRSFIRRRHLR